MRKSKTPLFHFLQKAFHIAAASTKPGAPPADELIDQAAKHIWTRREFLEKTGKAALLTGIGGFAGACSRKGFGSFSKKSQLKIAIVGAGMAGLHALHILRQGGVENVTVFEASNRAGGRMMTAQNILGKGLTTEMGGEFIDSNHADVLALAQHFGLELLDLTSNSERLLEANAYFFNGRHYSLPEVVAEFRAVASNMQADVQSLSEEINWENSSPDDRRLDNLSISEYLENVGCTGWLKELLEVAYETEFGLSAQVQSAISLLFLISTDTANGTFQIFGESDERFKVIGGNQQITDRLAALYPNHFETGRQLSAIERQGSQYLLHFEGSQPKSFDYVILTLPFILLRKVDIRLPLPAWKTNAIQNLGYGTNTKLMLGFSDRHWRKLGYQGFASTNNGMQYGWDNSQMQPGEAGGYTIFTGGKIGEESGNGTPKSQAAIFLPKLEQIFHGVTEKHNGKVARFHWSSFQWALGSYACYKTGQWTSIAGAEQAPVERLFFAGEHCSLDFQGFMNGAAETGRVAAQKILAEILK